MKTTDKLTLAYRICLWSSAVLGIVLLIDTLEMVIQLALATALFIVAVLAYTAWNKTAARVVARVLCLLLPVVFFGALGVYLSFYLPVVQAGGQVEAISRPTTILAIIGTPLFCWVVPGAASVAERGGTYDVWVARVLYTLSLALTAYCCLGAPASYMVWHWETVQLRYVWLFASVAGYILCWVCTWPKNRNEDIKKAEPELRL